jgi:hypothetical protein
MFKLHAEAAGNGLDRTADSELSATRRRRRARVALIAFDLPDLRSTKFERVRLVPNTTQLNILLSGVNLFQGQQPIHYIHD